MVTFLGTEEHPEHDDLVLSTDRIRSIEHATLKK